MIDHEFYEVLCTLAATGQLPASEKPHFDRHCHQCAACRNQLRDLMSVAVQLHSNAYLDSSPASMPAGAPERFRARAIREGIALRSTPARPSASYALATVAVVVVFAGLLAFLPHARKAAPIFDASTAANLPGQQPLAASVAQPALLSHSLKSARAHVARHVRAPNPVSDNHAIAQRFPQAIKANYSFLGPQISKSAATSYPALSRSQISLLAPFHNRDGSNDRSTETLAMYDRPTNIASTGNVYDFAANMHELHFQLPTAQ